MNSQKKWIATDLIIAVKLNLLQKIKIFFAKEFWVDCKLITENELGQSQFFASVSLENAIKKREEELKIQWNRL